MPQFVAGNRIRITLRGRIDTAQRWVQAHTFQASSSPFDPQAYFDAWLDAYKTAFQGHLTNNLQVETAVMTALGVVPWQDFIPTMDSWSGVENGATLASSDCMVVSWRSVHPGRTGRGRSYFSPILADHLEHAAGVGSRWKASYQAAFNTSVVDYAAALATYAAANSGDLIPYLLSMKDQNTYEIVQATTNDYIGSQRRRDRQPRI